METGECQVRLRRGLWDGDRMLSSSHVTYLRGLRFRAARDGCNGGLSVGSSLHA